MYRNIKYVEKVKDRSDIEISLSLNAAAFDNENKLLYAEIIGTAETIKDVNGILKTGRHYGDGKQIMSDSEDCPFELANKGVTEIVKLSKGMACLFYQSEAFSDKRFYALYGSKGQIERGFEKWLADINVLPYYVEEEEGDTDGMKKFRSELLDLMRINGLAYNAVQFGMGDEVIVFDKNAADGTSAMQQCIIKAMKKLGLSGLDRLREKLKTSAPAIGEMSDAFEVFAYFHLSTGATYKVIQYDADSDDFFASVVLQDGSFEWTQWNLENCFNDPKIGFHLGRGEMIDMMGETITEKEAA